MTMYAIASVLNREENETVHDLWDDLENYCNLHAVKFSPIPHFSWFTFQEVDDIEGLETELFNWALSSGTFSSKVNGLGIFPGESPVIYLPLVKNPILTSMHIDLLNRISPYIHAINTFYDPMDWIPHITLAFRDLQPDTMDCAIRRCMQFNLQFDVFIDHIAILFMNEITFGLKKKFDFGTVHYNNSVGGK